MDDGFAEKSVGRRRQQIRVREGRRLIGFVAFALGSMANGAHSPVELASVDLGRRQRAMTALERSPRNAGGEHEHAPKKLVAAHGGAP
jgi:hypothetical protein